MIKEKISISPEFKAQSKKAIASIILFILVYIVLMIASMALTVACLYAGANLIILRPSFITIVFGLGFMALGVLIFIFLVKFIFSSNKVDRSGLIEIKEKDEPKLFAMIHQIVKEVGTDFPKKVYLTSDVNAAVFYDSNFWSMFFPIRKNLMIGLGLVNSVNELELKSILSHEFGHFSQDSMKVGSYVYNVNQVIYNMLYDNEGFDRLVSSIASISAYIGIFVIIGVKIIHGIQWILQKLYEIINKSYMGLSREMEFQADEIAAHVTGYKPLANSLLRLELAQHSFTNTLGFYELKLKQNIKSKNIYKEQEFVTSFIAQENGLNIENGYPKVSLEFFNKYNKSKLVVKDQWASHPSTEERISKLKALNLPDKMSNNASANSLFVDIDKSQEKMTNLLFNLKEFQNASFQSLEQFRTEYKEEYIKNTFDIIYKEYFDLKNIEKFDVESVAIPKNNIDFESLISSKQQEISYHYLALINDIEMLKLIDLKENPIKTFDYDGKKYKKKEANKLITLLNKKQEEAKEIVVENDIKIYQYFLKLEKERNENEILTTLYKDYFQFGDAVESKFKAVESLNNTLQFLAEVLQTDVINSKILAMKPLEKNLKEDIVSILNNEKYAAYCDEDMRERFNKFLLKDYKYFLNDKYLEKNLELLFNAINDYTNIINQAFFNQKKNLLSYQASLIK